MALRKRAGLVIVAILAVVGIAAGGLHFFAEHGQWTPASATNNATMSDQRDAAVSSNVQKP
jgi:hypothetical protein